MIINEKDEMGYELLTRPSFTAAEAKELGVSTAHLGYYVKIGQIRRLGRGIYSVCENKFQIIRDHRQHENCPQINLQGRFYQLFYIPVPLNFLARRLLGFHSNLQESALPLQARYYRW